MSLLNMNMPSEGLQIIMRNIREQRLSRNWTQQALSERSGVSLSTLRKFEQTGKISLESFVKICFCLDILNDLIMVTETKEQEFSSMDQVLENATPKKRQRARGK